MIDTIGRPGGRGGGEMRPVWELGTITEDPRIQGERCTHQEDVSRGAGRYFADCRWRLGHGVVVAGHGVVVTGCGSYRVW